MKTKALVIGSNGFIGSHVYEYLLKSDGVEVHSLAVGFSETYRLGRNMPYLDYFDRSQRYNVIINCAAAINDDSRNLLESNFHLVNELIDICNDLKPAKLIHISRSFIGNTDAIYPTRLNSLYEYSKQYAEYAIQALCEIPFSLIRITAPIGTNMPRHRLLSQILLSIKTGTPVKIYGKGKRVQNYVFVTDIAKTIFQLTQKEILPKVCWVVGKENISDADLVAKVYSELNIKPSYVFTDPPPDTQLDENDYSFNSNSYPNDYISPNMSIIDREYLLRHLLCL